MSHAALAIDPTPQTPLMNRRTSILTGLAAATLAATASAQDTKENPELEEVRALLKAHDEAMKSKDLPGILALLTDNAAIMGTGPGEIWSGKEEITTAYEHFFQDFDKGEQNFEYQFKIGALDAGMGWLMASGNIKGKKDGKPLEFPINISLTVSKSSGKWLIASMHYSTLTGGEPPKAKGKKK
jgi:uncharacterized protein (TIGR02246 family)